MENVDTKSKETLNLDSELFSQKISNTNKIPSTILIKRKYGISHKAYHELSIIGGLPKSCQVKKPIRNMNSEVTINDAPNGIIGVQLSLVAYIKASLNTWYFLQKRQVEKSTLN